MYLIVFLTSEMELDMATKQSDQILRILQYFPSLWAISKSLN